MCNLYSMTKNQAAIRNLFKVSRDASGNLPSLPSLPAIFPDGVAPIVRNVESQRELTMMRWGMPGPPQFGGAPITNIRNTSSAHWRRWLKPNSRCLVPFTSFCEYADTKPRKTPMWFALDDTRPLLAFAGVWTPWNGTRGTKSNPVEGERKYGLGMVVVTQAPKGIDNKIVSNCTTQFLGKQNSPTDQNTVKEMIKATGGNAEDIGKLASGEFYFKTENSGKPYKLRTPLCLSHHPTNPPTPEDVVARAKASKSRLQ